MKKDVIKLEKALSFDKEIIAKLNDEQLSALEGGMMIAGTASCNAGPQTTGNTSCEACSCNG
ncbi:hypothetical protein GCM10011495_40410 [Hymenobacter frigidus]|uniref:Class I lanthipeptide n=1 Tax=Hymenobacter frigidus TaxID=1524095 RepID=A0ABQ2ALV5_9BACT|nr:class I lanthipeptide [Hymenobacter frigidus]GGH91709.1 hypothetical protein GCM10011495_40410 [Hymenobacter frigidus]